MGICSNTDRGEGANHAIIDVLDLAELVIAPHFLSTTNTSSLEADASQNGGLRAALDRYEDKAVARARPAVLASRQACLDAHRWARISDASPLLTRRAMHLDFDEADLC